MANIHGEATITAKGQITLPKPIRQALGVDYGGKVAFELRGKQIVVSRVDDSSDEDPAIASFLSILESDVKTGRHITTLPDDLVNAMLATLKHPIDLSAEIDGEVAL